MSVACLALGVLLAPGTAEAQTAATSVLEKIDVQRGLVAVVGDRTGEVTLELVRTTKALVYVQLAGEEDVTALGRAIDEAGLYGTRVWIEKGAYDHVHLAEHLANALVAVGDAVDMDEAEALRVVQPGGPVFLGDRRLTKPPLAGADDWSHPYHGPDNNPQSDDTAARAPYLTQFLADPRYAPVPQVAVAAGGRVFKAFGNVAFKEREEPWLNRLVAFDGYNGTILWIRNLTPGYMVHRSTIVATDERLYLADNTSCKVIDTATGEMLDEIVPLVDIAGGTFWKWMALEEGVLYALVGEDEADDPVERFRSTNHGWPWNRISKGFNAPENPWGYGRNLLAIDVATKEVRWQHHEDAPVDSRALVLRDGMLHLFRPGGYLVSLDATTGKERWRIDAPPSAPGPDDAPANLTLTIDATDKATGTITIGGVDAKQPTTPFTWNWGDGATTEGFFPQSHTYADRTHGYTIEVTAHYDDGTTAAVRLDVRFFETRAYAAAEAPALFDAIGPYLSRQGWSTNWRTTAYMKAGDGILYFSGPQVGKLLAVSTDDGRVLWDHPYDNFQLVLREEGLYGISGPFGQNVSRLFDPRTGDVRAELDTGRRACSRPTGSPDALFYRAAGGSTRLDVESGDSQWVSPMRAQCQDGVTIANGHLYWWPSVCDCNLTLYGVTSLGSAGDHDFAAPVIEEERREVLSAAPPAPLATDASDWPTFRANAACTATTAATIPARATPLWTAEPHHATRPTAPVAAGGLVFLGGADGIVRALDAETGAERWRAHTGGAIRIPPTIWEGRAFVGSGDGYVYCLEATTGRTLWRFRAAPVDRKIPVYGTLSSTWPVASGVTVVDGVAYFAAGIVNYDGTHVYALDAATGKLVWHNGTSGHLDPEARTGVCVQGHLLVHDDALYLAGGTAVSPAEYDLATGACRNDPAPLDLNTAKGSRGWELYEIGEKVVACGRPYYSDPRHGVYDADVFAKLLVTNVGELTVLLENDAALLCYDHVDDARLSACVADRSQQNWFSYTWGELKLDGLTPRWRVDHPGTRAIAVGANGIVLASEEEVRGVDLEDGRVLWSLPLAGSPVPWGLCVDRHGRTFVTLEDGRVQAFGADE